jgi:flagellar protein FlaG
MAIEGIGFPAASTLSIGPEGRGVSVAPEQRELRQAVRTVQNAGYAGEHSELSIAFDSDTRKNVVQIVDRVTKEVLSQIPSKDIIELAKYYKALESSKP